MFELSRNTRNLYYFNSDRLVAGSKIKDVYVSGKKYNLAESNMKHVDSNNGVHVALEVRKLIVRELVNSVGYLAGCRAPRFRGCGWLHHVTTRSAWAG